MTRVLKTHCHERSVWSPMTARHGLFEESIDYLQNFWKHDSAQTGMRVRRRMKRNAGGTRHLECQYSFLSGKGPAVCRLCFACVLRGEDDEECRKR